ncbi:MAG: cation transporting ATPase C-terminal domain-containing protein [Mycobacterium sp.]|nr:cation transporting ATPase C-terminal domain-containing protein [Mycobacterium sp.]
MLLDKDLAVIADGVVEGRRTLANTLKYVTVTASSNLGNVLTVVAAGAFLPMLPTQLLVQNLLYDAAPLALPWDRVDDSYVRAPRRWRPEGLVRFMLTFGAVSSIFDLATFAVLWYVFGLGHAPSTFQAGWFIEGTVSQLLIVLVLRTPQAPWRQPRPGTVPLRATAIAGTLAMLIPFSPIGAKLGFGRPPAGFWLLLVAVTAGYAVTAELVKRWYTRRAVAWL